MPAEEFHISKQVLDRFCVAGINYHKADAATRGMFSITAEDFADIAQSAKKAKIKSLFVISTCNRTEIYGMAESVMQLIELLVQHTQGDKNSFYEFGYLKNGEYALEHIFNVAAGLDSQILGDYEILGQLKRAVDLSKSYGLVGPVMDRIINFVYQASKKVKTETSLSNGTVSVSFATIELLQDLPDIENKRILVIGAGKFGNNICKNLRHYLPHTLVTVINRTDTKAQNIAGSNNLSFVPYKNKWEAINSSDVIIVCTSAAAPTVLPEHFAGNKTQLVLDLSVPENVHPSVKRITGVKVIGVDEISDSILDKTLAMRQEQLPSANAIIEECKNDLRSCLRNYHYALHLKTWKNKLSEIDKLHPPACEFYKDQKLIDETERVIKAQKAVKQLALNLKIKNDKGCQFINTINDYLQMR